jgi:hypothetical protein
VGLKYNTLDVLIFSIFFVAYIYDLIFLRPFGHELPSDVEAVWVLLHSVQSVVAPIGGSVLKAEENDLRQ